MASTDTGAEATARSPKQLARIAGLLYLLVGIFGGFAEGFVDPKMYVAGNATATAGNVVANAGLVRLGVVAHLLDGTFFVFLALVLHDLLQHVRRSVARAMLVLVALSTGIICLNAVFQFEGLRVATDGAYAAAFGASGSNALVLILLDTQHYGTLIAQVFFGLWLVPLGYLAHKSRLFPESLAVVLVVGGVCYLVDLLAAFLFPDFGQRIHAFVIIPSAIAEISMVLYLLVVGVKALTPTASKPIQLLAVAEDDAHLGTGFTRGGVMSTQIKLMMQLFALTMLTATPRLAKADDDLKDDSRRDAHDVKRAVKKAGDRVAEAACTGTEAECAAEKARHRRWEARRKAHDKAEEAKAEAKEKADEEPARTGVCHGTD